ncbi:uncharacterized protein Z518_08908 [Rhinocladiella mackenziei CBS 650.93]|uniref:Uncharacterized protein n=1 Tax=Rhinocladiella mackenziei CBS 650.93 TaxID=1442369 RepID=A0A0D2GS77_9EURO|nr:uncharacterized protein Z518_08908 [Rhinocladiella mackenziei CBS 650.93]KIX01183.1 hypothetical protein Z518_08908 [Rhinocladiella mackenziei CBS 650.93]
MALSIVYPPNDAATAPAVDIAAVHGLGGNAINSWIHPKSKKFWLKDFLQQTLDACIVTFGYDADAAFGKSTVKVIGHTKRLLSSLVDKREEPEV